MGEMASKWNGQHCALCGEGSLRDSVKTVTQEYKGQSWIAEISGAFCDHCADGFVEFDAAEEAAWLTAARMPFPDMNAGRPSRWPLSSTSFACSTVIRNCSVS